MNIQNVWVAMVTLFALSLATTVVAAADGASDGAEFVQYGRMHEAIGQQQHQGRVRLADLLERPHLFAVAALAELAGEVTICDGELTITVVDADGRLRSVQLPTGEEQATLLAGAYVPAWKESVVSQDIMAENFDDFVAAAATEAGVDTKQPFPFTLEGDFADVRLHVIHGACPLRARLRNTTIPAEQKPYEAELMQVHGRLVGVYAKDQVGNLTHPATSTHVHLLFTDPDTGAEVTGHLERIAVKKGAVLRLPKL